LEISDGNKKSMKRITLFVLLALLLVGCAVPTTEVPGAVAGPPKTPQALQPTPVSGALFVVVKPDGSEFGFTWAELKKLPLAQMTAEGKVEEGVKLMDVLAAAGVTEFKEVTLSGSSSPATLTFEQVKEPTTILDFTNHGTVKLSTNYVPKANWTKDVARIEVK
jgi:hypothetical protein